MMLEKPTPKDFLSRAGDKEQKQKDENLICSRPQRINPSYLGFHSWKNIGSQFVPEEKNKVEDGGRKKPENEGGQVKGYVWPLPK
jgi:hypothetical protein